MGGGGEPTFQHGEEGRTPDRGTSRDSFPEEAGGSGSQLVDSPRNSFIMDLGEGGGRDANKGGRKLLFPKDVRLGPSSSARKGVGREVSPSVPRGGVRRKAGAWGAEAGVAVPGPRRRPRPCVAHKRVVVSHSFKKVTAATEGQGARGRSLPAQGTIPELKPQMHT